MPVQGNIREDSVVNLQEVRHCPECGEPLITRPVLRCAHCSGEVALRCFTYKVKRGYIAECIDLDILAQGNTKEQAIGRLQEAMISYLQVAFEGNSVKGLVPRRSPLSHRLRYWLHMAFLVFRRKHLMLDSDHANALKACHC